LNLLKQYKEDIAENGWWMQTISSYYQDGLNYATDYEKAVESLNANSIQSVLKKILAQNNEIKILLMPENK
jgi:zinc protease